MESITLGQMCQTVPTRFLAILRRYVTLVMPLGAMVTPRLKIHVKLVKGLVTISRDTRFGLVSRTDNCGRILFVQFAGLYPSRDGYINIWLLRCDEDRSASAGRASICKSCHGLTYWASHACNVCGKKAGKCPECNGSGGSTHLERPCQHGLEKAHWYCDHGIDMPSYHFQVVFCYSESEFKFVVAMRK